MTGRARPIPTASRVTVARMTIRARLTKTVDLAGRSAEMPPRNTPWNPRACRIMRVIPSLSPRWWLSPYNSRVGLHIALFRDLHGVHSRCVLPDRRAANAARCLEGFDGFVTSAAAPIATGWSDQLPRGNHTR